MPAVPGDLHKYAQYVSNQTGLDVRVVEAWWISENGWKIPSGNNFGNIEKSNISWLSQGQVGTSPNGRFARYDTPDNGALAFANLINKGSSYTGIRASTRKSPLEQIKAIAASPWDENHYGGDGRNLIAVYNSITGVTPLTPGSSSPVSPVSPVIPSPSPGVVQTPGAIQTGVFTDWARDKVITVFWLSIGGGLVLLGIYLMFNPLGDLTNALGKLSLGKVVDNA